MLSRLFAAVIAAVLVSALIAGRAQAQGFGSGVQFDLNKPPRGSCEAYRETSNRQALALRKRLKQGAPSPDFGLPERCKPFAPFHPFVGIDVGNVWSSTPFAVTPPFTVSGSGVNFGVNGGLLIDIPNLPVQAGIRVGWQSESKGGSVFDQPGSPGNRYDVTQTSISYFEAMAIYTPDPGPRTSSPDSDSADRVVRAAARSIGIFAASLRASIGAARAETRITGMGPGLDITDSVTRTGPTFAVGGSIPILMLDNGVTTNLVVEHRVIFLPGAIVNIPGRVQLEEKAMQILRAGLEVRF